MWSPHSGFQRALESLGCWECCVQCPVISKEEPLVAANLAMQALENPFSKTVSFLPHLVRLFLHTQL